MFLRALWVTLYGLRAMKLHQTLSRVSINQTGLLAKRLELRTPHCAGREVQNSWNVQASRRDHVQLPVVSPAHPEYRPFVGSEYAHFDQSLPT